MAPGTGESPAGWAGLCPIAIDAAWKAAKLQRIVPDGCAGLAAARQTDSPRVGPQRGGVHTRRQLLGAARRRGDHATMKADAQTIDPAASRSEADHHAQAFARRWRDADPPRVTRRRRDRPELLAFFQCPRALWWTLRTTHVMERGFVEVRRRPRPRVWFGPVQRVERILLSICNRVNLAWRPRTLRQCTQGAGHHPHSTVPVKSSVEVL